MERALDLLISILDVVPLISTWKDMHFSPQEKKTIKAVVPRCSCSFTSISEMRFLGRGRLDDSQAGG